MKYLFYPLGVELPPAQDWDGWTQQCIWVRVPDPEFYLAQRDVMTSAFLLQLFIWEEVWITIISSSRAPPSTFYKKEAKWNKQK